MRTSTLKKFDEAVERRKNLRLVKAAERRAAQYKPHRLTNADQIRFLAVIALKTAKRPLSLYELNSSFRDVLKFKVRTEFLLMELLLKTDRTGIILLDGLRFGLKQWTEETKNS